MNNIPFIKEQKPIVSATLAILCNSHLFNKKEAYRLRFEPIHIASLEEFFIQFYSTTPSKENSHEQVYTNYLNMNNVKNTLLYKMVFHNMYDDLMSCYCERNGCQEHEISIEIRKNFIEECENNNSLHKMCHYKIRSLPLEKVFKKSSPFSIFVYYYSHIMKMSVIFEYPICIDE